MTTLKFRLLAFLILAMFFTACSNDSESETVIEETLQEATAYSARLNNNSLQELRRQYLNILATSKYREYQVSSDSFADKLPQSFNFTFTSEGEMINWLSANISTTRFNNLNQATSHFQDMSLLYQRVLDENASFFNSLAQLDRDDISIIIRQDPPAQATPLGECEKGCSASYRSCADAVMTTYNTQMAIGYPMIGTVLQPMGVSIQLTATLVKTAGLNACAGSAAICLLGC